MEMVEEGQNQPRKRSSKRLKIQQTLAEEQEDRISALPDCLILQILSLLPSTKDAIRTGTLSKRWKFLWTSIPVLILRYDDYNLSTFHFVCCVNKTLTQCRRRRSKLNKFELSIGYDSKFDYKFDFEFNCWIRYAISCNVEELKLMVWDRNFEAELLVHEQLFINPCFTDLTLTGCILYPKGAISWKMLRSLCIDDANLDEDLIEKILSGSPILETLELCYCYGYSRLNITLKSVKNLVVNGFGGLGDDVTHVVEINAPNILSLTIKNDLYLWKVLLLDVSSLVKAELDYYMRGHWEEHEEQTLKGFIQSLHRVKELKVGYHCSKVLSQLEAKGFRIPSNVKSFYLWLWEYPHWI